MGKNHASQYANFGSLLYNIATHKPVTGSKGKVYSMCGLCLQRVLYRADMFY